jgi:tartrate dehydrogenase/decarboxylase/D-malate dehydrogenase
MKARPEYRVAAIPGDGIGCEVVPAAINVLDRVATRYRFGLHWKQFDWGCHRYLQQGAMMPPDGLDTLAGADAIFLGAVGDPAVPDHASLWGLLIPIRRRFDLYANLRPVRLLPGVTSPLAAAVPADLDLLVVRENTEGEYSEIGGRTGMGERELAIQGSVFSRHGSTRILRVAFEHARARGGRLAIATKSNGIVHTMPFWDEISRDVAADYPDVTPTWYHVDALAARLVTNPGSLDVVVGSNLFGDVLSDLAAAIAGSLGTAPSANINPDGGAGPELFEPVHGSAPDIAGRGLANPVAALWSGSLMFARLGQPEAAAALDRAIDATTGAGILTPDLGGAATTAEVAAAVAAHF